jgi:hypothetical protein
MAAIVALRELASNSEDVRKKLAKPKVIGQIVGVLQMGESVSVPASHPPSPPLAGVLQWLVTDRYTYDCVMFHTGHAYTYLVMLYSACIPLISPPPCTSHHLHAHHTTSMHITLPPCTSRSYRVLSVWIGHWDGCIICTIEWHHLCSVSHDGLLGWDRTNGGLAVLFITCCNAVPIGLAVYVQP